MTWSRLFRSVEGFRDRLKGALVRYANGDVRSEARIANAVDSTFLIAEKRVREWVGRSSSLEKDFVEAKYDRLAGSYNRAAYDRNGKVGIHVVGDEFVRCPYADFYEARMGAYAEFIASLNGVANALDVGAGELTTTGALAIRLPEISFHGVELSYNRVSEGKRFFRDRFAIDVSVCRGDAMRLPFADRSFDLVMTSHCLEHVPFGYRTATDEIIRVAKRHVVLFEPIWETADLDQRLRMYAHGYVRGLLPYLESKGELTMTDPAILSVGVPFNRTTRLHLERPDPTPGASTGLVCPLCRGALAAEDEARICTRCRLRFPVRDGVPLMDPDDARPIGSVS